MPPLAVAVNVPLKVTLMSSVVPVAPMAAPPVAIIVRLLAVIAELSFVMLPEALSHRLLPLPTFTVPNAKPPSSVR